MSENVTPEGIEVKVGQVWRDLDKRMGNRHCKVMAVENGKARMALYFPDSGRLSSYAPNTKISIRRMKKSSTGWALVSESATTERKESEPCHE